MKKKYSVIIILALLLPICFSSLVSVSAENEESTYSTTDLTKEWVDPLSKLSTSTINENAESSTAGSKQSTKTTSGFDTQEEIAASVDNEQKKNDTTSLTKKDAVSRISVVDWQIISAGSVEISDKNAAISNHSYDLSFTAQVGSLNVGDTFAIEIPQVANVGVNDHWYMQPSDWIEQTEGEAGAPIYKYRIASKQGTNTQEIQFEALQSVSGIEMNHTFPSMLMNFVKTAGIYDVTFGAITRPIKFEINELKMTDGFSFKFNTAPSNNSAKWGIRFNGAGNLELSGDEVNYNVNGGVGNPYQGFYRDNPLRKEENWHQWGTRYTDVWSPNVNNQSDEANYGGYVEDELLPDANITQFSITGYINIPIGLTATDLQKQTGGIPSNTAAFESHVLMDYGSGPTYRKEGDTGSLNPKTGTGFKLLKQTSTETKSAFKARVQAAPYQYGIYEDGSRRKTVMIHFGNMKKTGNQQEKLSDLTDQKYSGKNFRDKDGTSRQIPQFAVEAANASIADQRTGYTENDRDLLERYFTLTYGDGNVLGGSIAAYNISLNVRYPPETVGAVSNTSNIYTHSALTLNRKSPETMPKRDGSNATLKNPYGHITISKTEVMLQKLDEENFDAQGDYLAINGAEFKLQKKIDDGWQDIKDESTAKIWTTDNIAYTDEGEEKQAPGLIKVDFSKLEGIPGGTSDGTYRFVETKAAAGFSDRDSPNWNTQAQAITSDPFNIPSPTSRGPTVTVWNRRKKATYKVEHYVQNDNVTNPDELTTDDFTLKETEEKPGEVGTLVNGVPLASLQPTYYYDANFSSQVGIVKGEVLDPSGGKVLVLKLYYTKDKSIPFTIYKLGIDGQPLKSIAGKNVQFQVYRFMYKNGTDAENIPPNEANIKEGYWNRIVVTNDLETPLVSKPGLDDPKDTNLILTTDSQGRIRDERLVYSTAFGARLALVEVENSHDGYEIPDVNDSYWVVQINIGNTFDWVKAGGAKPITPIKYKPPGSTVNYWAIQNTFEVQPNIFKVDENDQLMPTANDKTVEFDIYKYIGADNIRPDKATDNNVKDHNNPLGKNTIPNSDGKFYKDNWEKVTSTPCRTDENGKIVLSDGSELGLDPGTLYSFIETKSYEGYQIPNNQSFSTNRTSHWLVSLSGDLKTGPSGYVDSRPIWTAPMYENKAGFEAKADGIYLKNQKLTDVPIFKVDENLKPIRQHSADNFEFESFIFNHTETTLDYKKFELEKGYPWIPISNKTLADSFNFSGSGRLFTEDQTLEKKVGRTDVADQQIIAIREKKGMNDYIFHKDAYWVVILKWDPVAKVNKVTSIDYFTGSFDQDGYAIPGAIDGDGETPNNNRYHELINGEAYLKNKRVPTFDFSFIKENETQQTLGNVEFALYREKNDSGKIDPNESDTRWDLTEKPYRESTSSNDSENKGQVDLKNLASGDYLLLETKTVTGYDLPQGYWIITIDAEAGKVDIDGSDDPKPPAFRIADGKYYLPNYRKTFLPNSGGIGKIILLIIGIVLLGLAIAMNLKGKKASFQSITEYKQKKRGERR
ncbi:prealbumin-like fold domain-containing protein [Enterococcus devriesei]|uniref:prealbumin-like fold domain-containing protein n=1 Tax=Enterococcus devriesei TaxID=319970 RepID=UPI0028905DE6|nr:prealbumin-like fold domain-containing protein [Enterococcus devriesei]MDT2821948.1 prealbumin-like fold domain-containing protein [Enterococcus devriesei]